jgi:hypothetical protein
MKTREEILSQAVEECITEMFKWAQPSVDLKELIANNYKDDEKNPLWKTHYLSEKNFDYIRESYATAYGIVDEWDDTFETIYNQLENGGVEVDYKPAEGDKPGYKGYKKVDPLKMHLHIPEDYDEVIDYIKKIQHFFKYHSRELNSYNMTICLGVSPNSNKEAVEKYWQENGRPNFRVKDYDISDVIYSIGDYENITEEEFLNSLK